MWKNGRSNAANSMEKISRVRPTNATSGEQIVSIIVEEKEGGRLPGPVEAARGEQCSQTQVWPLCGFLTPPVQRWQEKLLAELYIRALVAQKKAQLAFAASPSLNGQAHSEKKGNL
uniref:Uncharacterized protein n=1 Tax=Sphaerodactylus townsendi TaxID=933632 RepID=A0ACB8EQI9_9SAUR